MKVVVTGATGGLGQAAVRALRAAGHEVVALGRHDADLTVDASVAILASHLGPEVAVVHLAALHPADPACTTASDRRALIDTNVHGTLRVLEACRDVGAARIVFASTDQVEGATALTDFAATKLAGEDHLRVLREEAGVPFVVLRLAALIGPGVRARTGASAMIEASARGERPELDRPAGCLLDVVAVDDAAAAIALAVASRAEGIFAIADGVGRAAVDLARAVMQVAGMTGEPIGGAGGALVGVGSHADIGEARGELGFTPRVPLEEAVHQQIAWVRAGRR